MANPELRENFQPDANMELNNLKAEVTSPDPNVESLPDILMNIKDAKVASSQELQTLRQQNILWSDNKVCVKDVAEELLDLNYNNSSDAAWKNLWKNPRYVANVQVALSIFGESCSINGSYDSATKDAIQNLIRRYKGRPDFKLNSDGSVPASMRNVLVNALMFPKWDRGTEIVSKDRIPLDTKLVLEQTTWDPIAGKIKTLKKWGKYYS